MPTLKITSKRQATFPKEVCDDLRLKPGDQINLERRVENGGALWVLRPKQLPDRKWTARLTGRTAHVKDHSMEAVRKSIAERRKTSGE